MQQQEMVNNFNHTNKNMLHDEIVFHMKRGETLLVQSAQGKWLRSIYWGYLPHGEYAPIACNWDNKIGSICSLDDVPRIGPQTINDEIVIISFCKFPNNGPIWAPSGPAFITPLPTFNLRENIKFEMAEREWDVDMVSEKSGIPKAGVERLQRFLIDNQGELPNEIIKKIADGLEIREAKLRGYGDDESYIAVFETSQL